MRQADAETFQGVAGPAEADGLGDSLGVRAPAVLGEGVFEAGRARCADPHRARWDYRYRGPCIAVVTSGVFNYRSAAGSSTAVPGTVLFGNAGEAFNIEHLDTMGNRRLYVALRPDVVAEVANDCGLDAPAFAAPLLEPSAAATALYGHVAKIAGRGLVSDEAVVSLIFAALQLGRRDLAPPISRAQRVRVLEVVRRLEEDYAEPCALADLADLAGLSRHHFIRVFREVTGTSPHQYLVNARLRAAADQLLDPAASITHVAFAVGFNELSNFDRAFRGAFGLSPRQWRANARGAGRSGA